MSRFFNILVFLYLTISVVAQDQYSQSKGNIYTKFISAEYTLPNNRAALCPIVPSSPVIDGKLDDKFWGKCSEYKGFKKINSNTSASMKTSFRISTDRTKIYIGASMDFPDAQSLKKIPVSNDNSEIFSTDCVEIFLSLNRNTYYQFVFGPTGSYWDSLGGYKPIDYNYNIEFKTHIYKNKWVLEAAIPLYSLDANLRNFTAGDIFSLNVCREYSDSSRKEISSWNRAYQTFHNVNKFAQCIVGTFQSSKGNMLNELKKLNRKKKNSLQDKSINAELRFLDGMRVSSASDWKNFYQKVMNLKSKIILDSYISKNLLLFEVNPWDLPGDNDIPIPEAKNITSLKITGHADEYITKALAVFNPSSEYVSLHCIRDKFAEKVDGSKKLSGDFLQIRRAVSVELYGNRTIRDALVPCKIDNTFIIPPKGNAIIWLTVATSKLSAGTFKTAFTITNLTNSKENYKIGLNIKVFDRKPPSTAMPFTYNWYYPGNRAITKKFPEQSIIDLKKHYINIVPVKIDFPIVDSDGNINKQPTFSVIRDHINKFGVKGNFFLIYYFYKYFPLSIGRGSPEKSSKLQTKVFNSLVKQVRMIFKEKGVDVKNYAWYAHDEACSVEDAQNVVNFYRRLKAADPQQQVFATVFNKVQKQALVDICKHVDVLVASRILYDWQWEVIKQNKQKTMRMFIYSVLSKAKKPYFDFRLTSWFALKKQSPGYGFWCYDDVRTGLAWDDSGKPDYSVVYEGASKPVSSVRWEAWRQGVEDYRIVSWINQLKPDKKAEIMKKIQYVMEHSGNDECADKIIAELENNYLFAK